VHYAFNFAEGMSVVKMLAQAILTNAAVIKKHGAQRYIVGTRRVELIAQITDLGCTERAAVDSYHCTTSSSFAQLHRADLLRLLRANRAFSA
jgi:hypothetical protein